MKRFAAALMASSLVVAAPLSLAAQTLHTSQGYVEEVTRQASFDIQDPMAVFAYVFGALPERVQVFPTENYHYIRFIHNGVPYTGNLRLAAHDRDKGILHFTYGNEPSDWNTTIQIERRMLGKAQGVTVERVEDLTYRVTFRDRSVIFALNDLSRVRPPDGMLRADEVSIGPVFDEAVIPFFLVFNQKLKVFHYILDETRPVADAFTPLRGTERIVIGKRTGFAFYQDGDRKVMIGANARASMLNTRFDGPFDQIPENFIEGEVLRNAILAIEPELKGRMDRLGNLADSDDRFLIHPYLLYDRPAGLAVFERCLESVAGDRKPLCFVISDEEAQKPRPQPLGMMAGATNDKPARGAAEPPVALPETPPGAAMDGPGANTDVPAVDKSGPAGAAPADAASPTDVVPPTLPLPSGAADLPEKK